MFRNWLEQKWHEFKETVTLYHGTSSAFLSIMRTEGIKPPQDNLEEYALKVISWYGVDPSPKLLEWIKKHSLSLRTNGPLHKTANVIYLSPNFKTASSYSKYYYKHGGELAYEIWRAINVIESKKRGLPKTEEIIPPIHKNTHPIVVEIQVPFQWMKTYHNLDNKYREALKYWEDHWKDEYPNVNDFLTKEISDFEVRVEETIPASMIKNITNVDPHSSD